jgi:phospholipase D1/2
MSSERRIVRVGGEAPNAWRLERAPRAGVIVDADAYFRAVHHAIVNARRQVLLLGWDIDSRLCLRRDLEGDARRASRLAQVLSAAAARRGGPECFILSWDFALIYAFEREAWTQLKLGWSSHRRLHFELDDMHPVGASQHQKVVVIDDALAFCGGLDLCGARWDTPAHEVADPRRWDPPLRPHPPFHDVQMAVTGPAAAALGDLARERWFRATGERVRPPRPASSAEDRAGRAPGRRPRREPASWSALWEPGIPVDFEDVRVAIARTEPAFNGRAEVREVERLYLDMIARARSSIYIENQYFTSHTVGSALAQRLAEDDGPEVLLVQPRECSGWLEESTMGVLRRRLIHELRAADRHRRLKLYYGRVPGDAVRLNIHSKLMIVDDELLRVGSANLSNRSMGFDSECDLTIEAQGDRTVAARIAAVRARLLAEHLGTSEEEVMGATAAHGLLQGVEALRQPAGRTLAPLDVDVMPWLENLVTASVIIDPERVMSVDPTVNRELPPTHPRRRLRAGIAIGVVLLVLAGLGVAWRTTAVGQLMAPSTIIGFVGPFLRGPLGPLAGIAAYMLGGLVVMPLTLLHIQTGLLFGPVTGFLVALSGALLSALLSYGCGRALGAHAVRRVVGRDRLRALRGLQTSGALAIAAFRLLPVAPFTMVNLAAGAARLPVSPYLVGTLIGVLPGTLTLTLFASGIAAAIRNPSPGFVASVIAGLVALVIVATSLYRFVRRRQRGAPPLKRAPPRPAPVPLGPTAQRA